jgi:Uma2 family endonuclease
MLTSKDYGDVLTLPDLLPGWEMTIAELWAPEFD